MRLEETQKIVIMIEYMIIIIIIIIGVLTLWFESFVFTLFNTRLMHKTRWRSEVEVTQQR